MTVSPLVSGMPAARAVRQEGWAVRRWAARQVPAGARLAGASLVGFRRALQFGASVDVILGLQCAGILE